MWIVGVVDDEDSIFSHLRKPLHKMVAGPHVVEIEVQEVDRRGFVVLGGLGDSIRIIRTSKSRPRKFAWASSATSSPERGPISV